jgi:hypothetical protein
VADLGELNTGDPEVFASFLQWGLEGGPFDYVALFLWGHGTGAMDFTQRITPVRSYLGSSIERVFFTKTAARELEIQAKLHIGDVKAIAADYSANMDSLENAELSRAMRSSLVAFNKRLDVLVLDACFMGSIEFLYEIQDLTAFAVVSPATVPNEGLPYDAILAQLINSPELSPRELGALIVSLYERDYQTNNWFVRTPVTLATVDVQKLSPLVASVNSIAGRLLSAMVDDVSKFIVEGSIKQLWSTITERFGDKNFVDLYHFLNGLATHRVLSERGITDGQPILPAAAMQDAVTDRVSVIRRDGANPPPAIDACGLTIHFPASPLALENLKKYLDSTFCTTGAPNWGRLLARLRN